MSGPASIEGRPVGGTGMDELAFDEAMMRICVRARDEVGYNATRYLQM